MAGLAVRRHTWDYRNCAVVVAHPDDKLAAREVWRFAYEDGGGRYLPRLVPDADIRLTLTEGIWQKKCDIITGIYGYGPDSFEAKTAP